MLYKHLKSILDKSTYSKYLSLDLIYDKSKMSQEPIIESDPEPSEHPCSKFLQNRTDSVLFCEGRNPVYLDKQILIRFFLTVGSGPSFSPQTYGVNQRRTMHLKYIFVK